MVLLELFAVNGSVGRVFRACAWEVVSLDLDARSGADIITNIQDWDFTQFPDDHFDCVWSSPPCTEFSIARTTARPPRNLELADAIVQRKLDIIAYFGCAYWMENLATGLLASRPVVRDLAEPYSVSYCMFGRSFPHHHYLWTHSRFRAPK